MENTRPKITPDDLKKIAELLKMKAGITINVMPNEFTKQGKAILLMHPNDIEEFNEIFEKL